MALRQLASGAFSMLTNRFALAPVASRGFATVMDGLLYAKTHEWVKLDGDVATVGISDFAQAELGDVVYVELPEDGAEVAKGESFGVVESVKAASDVYAPVSGTVVEANALLTAEPAILNSEPFEKGWMMKVKISDKSDLDALLSSEDYSKFCESSH